MLVENNKITLPDRDVLESPAFQNRLRNALNGHKDNHKFSRRDLHALIPETVWRYEGKIYFGNGRAYPRAQAFDLIGHESGKAISNFLAYKKGVSAKDMPVAKYEPRSDSLMRLQLFWLYLAIVAPNMAKNIIC